MVNDALKTRRKAKWIRNKVDRYAGRVDVEPGGVVVQELELWLRLERALPDYADRKRWLAENARAFEL